MARINDFTWQTIPYIDNSAAKIFSQVNDIWCLSV